MWTPANLILICLFSSDLSINSDENSLNLRVPKISYVDDDL